MANSLVVGVEAGQPWQSLRVGVGTPHASIAHSRAMVKYEAIASGWSYSKWQIVRYLLESVALERKSTRLPIEGHTSGAKIEK